VGVDDSRASRPAWRELRPYIQRLLWASKPDSAAGTLPNVSAMLRRGGGRNPHTLANGEKVPSGSRQLQAQLAPLASRRDSEGLTGFSIGNNWLLSPIVGALSSIFGLFGASQSTRFAVRYRAKVREPFQLVEAISPETRTKPRASDERSNGFFGIGQAISAAASRSTEIDEKRKAPLGPAASVATGFSRQGQEDGPRGMGRWSRWAGGSLSFAFAQKSENNANRLGRGSSRVLPTEALRSGRMQFLRAGSVGRMPTDDLSRQPRALAQLRGPAPAGQTSSTRIQEEHLRSSAVTLQAPHIQAFTSGVPIQDSSKVPAFLPDRQALLSSLRRSLSDSRGILDVLNEFQDGL